MDRRDFFKTIFATPLLAPFLLTSRASAADELFLISDSPESFFPSLLEGMGSCFDVRGRSFSVLESHPQKEALSHALMASGWSKAPSLEKADLTLSFRPLQHPTPSSFTVVRAGKILDARSNELFSVWKELQEKHPPSSCLTIATLRTKLPGNSPGTDVRIYRNGQVVEEASLKKDRVQTFWGGQGKITLKIDQGKASFPSSSCRHKICCSVPPVHLTGERIVCAPNHVLLEVLGPSSIDTIIG